MTIGNCSRVTYDSPHAVASYFKHIPPQPLSTHSLFPPKNDIFSYFKKESSSDSSQKVLLTIENCSRVTYDGPHAVANHFEHIPPHPLSTHSMFPPKSDIFSYFKQESSSDSAQKVLWPLETVLGWPMIAPMRWQAISSTFHHTHFPPTACFHPKVTFSAISNGNQALNQPKRYHDHWKLFKGDLWWPPFGSKPFWAHSTTPPFHPKPVSTQKWHFQLFQKGIKLWFSQKRSLTNGNCCSVTYYGPHVVASHFHHIPSHPLSTHSLFPPNNSIFSAIS